MTRFRFQDYILSLLFWAVSASSYGQFEQTQRFEREQNNSDNAWMVISMKESGLALVRDKEKFRDGLRLYEVALLDSNLQEYWSTELELHNRLHLIGYDFADHFLYLLFREGETDDADLQLTTIGVDSKIVSKAEIKHEFSFKLTHFSAVGRNVVLGGYVNREPAVLLFNPSDGQLKVVPGFFTSETELLDLRVNQNHTFNTLVTNRSTRSNRKLALRTFDEGGVQLLEDEIEIDPNKNILTGLTSSLKRDELMVGGTFTTGTSKQASGIFTVLVDPFKEQVVNYYDFAQLNHGLDFMNPKRALKISESARRDRLKGRDPDYRCYASTVRLEEYSEGFLLLVELYSMSSGMNTSPYQNSYPYYGSPYGLYPFSPFASRYYNSPYSYSSPSQSSEVRVLESAVVSISPSGKWEWDHSLPVEDKRKTSLEQASDFWSDRNKIVLAYKHESELHVKARYKNDETQSDTLKIMVKNPNDVVRNESKEDEGVRHWFGDYFYVWGYQSLKDPTIVNDDRNRSVFYLVKLHVK
jgi:hypothetical protein